MYLIEKRDYLKIKKIIGNQSHGIFPGSVCAGKNPGWIYANDPQNPSSAFVYMKKLGVTLIGDSNNIEFNHSLKENLDTLIIPKMIDDNEECFAVTGLTPDWNKSIEFILENRDYEIERVKRYKYVELGNPLSNLNEEIEIQEITEDLLNKKSIKNTDLVIKDIETWWESLDSFFKEGCGFIALKQNEICGWSYSVCIVDSKVEIYIETVEQYRNIGIGTAIAYRFVQHCLNHKLKPEWEAMSDIEHSIQIAEKIGFKFDYEYKLYEFDLD